ncbi:O-methylsterigmatocystin oxidoreductase OS=Aspergillus flavus GN=ordA PE=3 SV=2 [Rhizoctonia solani AG-1 IB]|uniref:O-methylsterigmatocystin oxidoreductase n=1 Tax=Thanatephorus cucumeris (strain AG1-IB / isolate 7/3/14) TaxID=1108050 RepID=A0A0B7FBJ3_THACB|nr:O-methylsterigmatocystin oxidoreductase OS=Aspergillus flavus GN=ordA PE=3 SV=2 [Rhizoctonia solani AG-1 IB]
MSTLDWLASINGKRATLYASLVLVLSVLLVRYKRKPRHPPSLRPLPIIGHSLWLASGLAHLDFMKIGEQLKSDIIFLNVFGQHMVVLNSSKAASDLLEKRSSIYSDRLCPPFGKDPNLFNLSANLSMLGYNDTWRRHRRMLNKWLNVRAVIQFDSLLEHQAALLLKRLLVQTLHPKPFETIADEFFFATGSTMLKLVPLVLLASGFAVNIFPFLSYVPGWLPGTGWKRTAREWREHKEKTYRLLYKWTKSQVAAGIAEPSVLSFLMQDEELTAGLTPEEKELNLTELSIALYGGGTETTSGTLMKFIAAMVINPDVQAKAQKEIDSIVGPDTFPRMSDRDRLPYVRNLISEVLRWHTVSPVGVPHVCSQNDIYRGYNIEKGTVVIGNAWAMSRDKAVYEDPELFNPDRFLNSDVPYLAAFGWGRRICPGLHFAESMLFIMITSLLSTFTFYRKKDAGGREIIPQLKGAPHSPSFTLKPFEFEFKVRSETHRNPVMGSNMTH